MQLGQHTQEKPLSARTLWFVCPVDELCACFRFLLSLACLLWLESSKLTSFNIERLGGCLAVPVPYFHVIICANSGHYYPTARPLSSPSLCSWFFLSQIIFCLARSGTGWSSLLFHSLSFFQRMAPTLDCSTNLSHLVHTLPSLLYFTLLWLLVSHCQLSNVPTSVQSSLVFL